jgi:hypothetical protein
VLVSLYLPAFMLVEGKMLEMFTVAQLISYSLFYVYILSL